jgi:hypothetical protein
VLEIQSRLQRGKRIAHKECEKWGVRVYQARYVVMQRRQVITYGENHMLHLVEHTATLHTSI